MRSVRAKIVEKCESRSAASTNRSPWVQYACRRLP